MSRRDLTRVCLGLQWDTATWNEAPSWWDFLLSRIQDTRVLWNLAPLPPDASRRRPGVPRELAERVNQAGDAVSCRGFGGCYHPLLTLDELEKELAWGVKNPWGTGITEVLGLQPTVLGPRLADLLREDALKAYTSHGFRWIAAPGPRAPARIGTLGLVSVSTVAVAPLRVGDPNLRKLRQVDGVDSVCMLDLSGLSSADALRLAFEELGGGVEPRPRGGVEPRPAGGAALALVDRLKGTAEECPVLGSAPQPDWSALPAPTLRASLRACEVRHRKRRNEDYREVLLSMGSTVDDALAASAAEPEPRRELRLVAHMLGEVVLAGRDFDVRLNGGRFHGLVRKGSDLTPAVPAASYLRLRGRYRPFRGMSSFSFDSDEGTGLREELRLDGFADANLSIEYGFRGDSSFLTISVETRYPVLDPAGVVEEHAPLTLTLTEGREPAWVDSAAPDGSRGRHLVSPGAGWVMVPCASLRVRNPRGGWLILRFPPQEGRGWGLPFLRFRRAVGRYLLEVNPFGGYGPVPASALSGIRERFTLEVGVER